MSHGEPSSVSGKVVSSVITWTALYLALSCVVAWRLLQHLRLVFRSDLSKIPGPTWARLTAFWRPWVLLNGTCPDVYQELHDIYGPLVRTAPGVVSISDPAAISTIYGIGSKYCKVNTTINTRCLLSCDFPSAIETRGLLPIRAPSCFKRMANRNVSQSMFYTVFDVAYGNGSMPSMFSVREPAQHQALRRPVAQKFSMSSMKAMEPFADDCNDIFIEAMTDLEGKAVDLGTWLQWYAFDVISAITFHRRLGFMEQRKDVENMIGDISQGLAVLATIGQVPSFHPWLLGSKWLPMLMQWQPFFRAPDPLRTVVKVNTATVYC